MTCIRSVLTNSNYSAECHCRGASCIFFTSNVAKRIFCVLTSALVIFLSSGLAKAEDPTPKTIALGRELYAINCASCHGTNLEGQPNWRGRNPDGSVPAPPHDASGHTWHHAEDVLFRITKKGAVVRLGRYESDMPSFEETLSDAEILAILAFIASTWPDRQRENYEKITRRYRGVFQ